ncbi:MAG: 2-oxoglutarate dehydrogenase E1 component [Planctomycetota bacterium]|nr:2-oxoglutarate dehydrogenase E1 component [Planctomycetota bacterium]
MTSSQNTPAPAAVRAVPASINSWSADYLEQEYARFRADPESLSADLRAFFQGFDLARAGAPAEASGAPAPGGGIDALRVAYRSLGHLAANISPLAAPPARPSELDAARAALGDGARTAIDALERAYCGSIGVEFMHCETRSERDWFVARFEGEQPTIDADERRRILDDLTRAEVFDRFLGKRYQGKKRFSLEGGESVIPLLRAISTRAGELGCEEIILGMAHRGRLSVLRNFLGKDLQRLFTEFEDSWAGGENEGGGDVKYHRGYSGDHVLPDGRRVHLSMLNNPSHLESVNPVVLGKCRAKQDRVGDTERRRIASLLIHGDAAIAGQGVVAECLVMSRLDGYAVGGTLHIVINNLVGFTTDPTDSRSTRYCTDIAKSISAPVLHVNADDPEAVVRAARIAAEYRHEFRRDVFIDLVCFRRHGHNEQDEPTYTQPRLYEAIRAHPGTAEVYRRRLIGQGVVTEADAGALADAVQNEMDAAQTAAKSTPMNPVPPPGGGVWEGFNGRYDFASPDTGVPAAALAEVCAALGRVPEGFAVHSKLKNLLASRAALAKGGRVAHADAELLAIGTLLLEGRPVRLSGQDSRRGTFTQRHAVLRDERTGERYTPLNHVRSGQARFDVWDSPLSEFGVMGFDYGYSRGSPGTLVLWEAQFGDFVNGAQVMIDQYLASSEVKWSRWAGLTLLLPHGYEGQGPEHSSARLERFLQLCADDNMEVVYPSTASQIFHLLRRQALRAFRKPLIVMTPKKYLRFESSDMADLTHGSFQHLIDDPAMDDRAAAGVRRVVYCSGKVYHELAEKRGASRDVAIVRVEQLYPFHTGAARAIDARYPRHAERVWAQEEPRNQGAFLYAFDEFRTRLGVELAYVGRPPSASPATGSEHLHKQQQERLLAAAVAPGQPSSVNGPAHAAAIAEVREPHAPAPQAAGKPAKSKR